MNRLFAAFASFLILLSASLSNAADYTVFVVEKSENWRFTEQTQPVDWTAIDFDDDAWKVGHAPLGFGEPDLGTITFVPDASERCAITTYFRKEFEVVEVSNWGTLQLKIRVDDGFVAYLNGTELQRWNVPSGSLTADTLASEPLSAPEERRYQRFDVAADAVRAGRNLLAIEVHQINNQSTDLYLDVELSSEPIEVRKLVQATGNARSLSLEFNSLHTLPWKTLIPDGFIDGGREMQMDEFGYAVSNREILRVDRARDIRLQKHLEFARSTELANLDPIDRATRLARYVDATMTPANDRESCISRSEVLAERYRGKEVLLGDVVDLCGAGVCRHRALMFNLMANEAALTCTIVRGNYVTQQQASGHTWNELLLDDGKRVIVDVMNPQPDFYFPSIGEPSLRYYFTVAGAAKYPPGQRGQAAD